MQALGRARSAITMQAEAQKPSITSICRAPAWIASPAFSKSAITPPLLFWTVQGSLQLSSIARLTGELRGIVIEGNAIDGIDAEIVLTTGNRGAGQGSLTNLLGAAGNREHCQNGGDELGDANTARQIHSGAIHVAMSGHHLCRPW